MSENKSVKLFSEFGEDVREDEALKRKDELVKATAYMNMSEKTNNDLRTLAVNMGLIPPIYKNASFDKEKIQQHVLDLAKSSRDRIKVSRYNEYCETCYSIINTVRVGKLPTKSYIIGAPSGFGKQSFAVDCILASLHNGWVTVPYISLMELGEIRAANDRVIERGLMGMETKIAQQPFNYATGEYEDGEGIESYYWAIGDKYTDLKTPTIITGRYSWSEYINTPLLVCFFSGIESKVVESQTLYTILNIRSAKGFPTIALISTSLEMYKRDPVIGRYVWSEILTNNKDSNDVSRVYHVSTYKIYNNEIIQR